MWSGALSWPGSETACNAPNMTMAMARAPAAMAATVGATTSLARTMGFALGPALATVVWAAGSYDGRSMQTALAIGALVGALSFGVVTIPATRRLGVEHRARPNV